MTNLELIAAWAAGKLNASAGNLSIRHGVLYSYDMPIAYDKFIIDPSTSPSRTTSRHISTVFRIAARDACVVAHLPYPYLNPDTLAEVHTANLMYMVTEYQRRIAEPFRPKSFLARLPFIRALAAKIERYNLRFVNIPVTLQDPYDSLTPVQKARIALEDKHA